MREVILPPAAPAMLDSLRALGYSFESALADILDNSIAAGARNIDIQFRTDPSLYIAVIDDGSGMSEAELEEAMRHGGVGPNNQRARGDLGRFGLGLKTASLSQCRKLTVLTKKDGVRSGATWNLDRVEETGDWVVGILSDDELDSAARGTFGSTTGRLRRLSTCRSCLEAWSLDASLMSAARGGTLRRSGRRLTT